MCQWEELLWMLWTELSLCVTGGTLTQMGMHEEKSKHQEMSFGLSAWRQLWSADSCTKLWVDYPPDPFPCICCPGWAGHRWARRRGGLPSGSLGLRALAIPPLWLRRGGEWACKEGTEKKVEDVCAINVSSVPVSTWLEAVLLVSPVSMVGWWGFSRQPLSMAGYPYYSRLSLMRMWHDLKFGGQDCLIFNHYVKITLIGFTAQKSSKAFISEKLVLQILPCLYSTNPANKS